MKKAREATISLAKMGLSVDKIAQALNINVETVEEWLEESLSVVH